MLFPGLGPVLGGGTITQAHSIAAAVPFLFYPTSNYCCLALHYFLLKLMMVQVLRPPERRRRPLRWGPFWPASRIGQVRLPVLQIGTRISSTLPAGQKT